MKPASTGDLTTLGVALKTNPTATPKTPYMDGTLGLIALSQTQQELNLDDEVQKDV